MNRSRHLLRTGTAFAALSAALVAAPPAQSQGILASGSVVGGNANAQISTSANQTNVLVNSSQAIIDWRPNETSGLTPINVLPDGNALYFDANQGVTNFTVLNRIQPFNASTESNVNRVIELNGTVQSRIGNNFGGNIWFYSAGGILVGATGQFDVGGLVLTTNAIDVTDGLFGTNGEIRFRGTADSASSVMVNAGAQINALAVGSYVAMVAPSVIMNGQVNVDGSVAYVGAEQADLTINGGLFDIAITVGTSQAHGVEHGGTTTGPASTAATDSQRAVMVAVPKNQAMTMLLSGSIGYAAATDATLEGSAVILSAGHDIREGAISSRSPAAELAAMAIGTADFSSAVTGQATGTIAIDPAAAGTTTFQSTASFGARGDISVSVGDGETVRAQQGLSLTSTIGAVGGSISLTADRGLIDITPGTLSLNARGDASNEFSGTGGTITLNAIGGGRIAAGQIDADAGASAGPSRNATGGSVTLDSTFAGVIEASATNLRASGDALFNAGEPNPDAGDGIGGTIRIQSSAGRLQLGDVNAVAQGTGGNASSGQGGAATGGDIFVNLSGGTHQWSSLFADVSTAAGYTTQGGDSGSAQGGDTGISINVTGSETTLDISRSVSLYADAHAFGGGANAAEIRGGRIAVATGDGGTLQVAQDLYAQSRGDGSNFNIAQDTAATPDVFGGTISIAAPSGSIRAGALLLYADAAAGFGNVVSGKAFGGAVTVDIGSAGSLTLSDCPIYSCVISAGARGGSSLVGSDATGGTIDFVNAGDAFSSTGQFYVEANGRGGRAIDGGNGQGANGTGGAITFTNSGTSSFGQLFIEANGSASEVAEGFFFGSGSGGVGRGGSVRVNQAAGSLTADLLRATADGEGGFAGANCVDCTPDDAPFTAGNGVGGSAGFALTGGTATIDLLSLYADGVGGAASSGEVAGDIAGLAGNGSGGNVGLGAVGGSLTTDSIILSANGQGGLTQDVVNKATNSGGMGTGGTAGLSVSGASITAPNLIIRAEGMGGNAGAIRQDPDALQVVTATGQGGTGQGGIARLTLVGSLTAASVSVSAEGVGGNGSVNETEGSAGSAGSGAGGDVRMAISGSGNSLNGVTVSASGEGGVARNSRAGSGGMGGNGRGGFASVTLDADGSIANLTVLAEGIGTDGGSGGNAGGGGFAYGGTADVSVNGGDFTISERLDVSANGEGGAVGLGADVSDRTGGHGGGGSAAVGVFDDDVILRVNQVNITSDGDGGAGGARGEPGGTANGGAISMVVASGELRFAGLLNLSSTGSTSSVAAAQGGTSSFQVTGGSVMAGEGAGLRLDSSASGFSDASAGTTRLTLVGATTSLPDVTLDATSRLSAPGQNRGGTVLIRNGTTGDGLSAPNVAAITADASALGTGTAGSISVVDQSTAGSLAVSGMLSLTAQGAVDPASSGIAIGSTSRAITAGSLSVATSGPISMDFFGAGALRVAGTATLDSGTDIRVNHINRADGVDSLYAGQRLDLTAGNAILAGADSQLRSGGNATLQAGAGNISIARLAATGNVDLRAPQGSITVSEDLASGGTVTAAAALGIDLRALADIDIASAVAGQANAISIVGDGALTLANAQGGSIRAQAGFALVVRTATAAAGGIAADSGASNVTLTDVSARDALTSEAGGSIALTNSQAGSIDLTASRDVALTGSTATAGGIRASSATGGVTLTDLSATGGVQATAGGGISLRNVTASGAITARSGTALVATSLTAQALTMEAGDDLSLTDSVASTGPIVATNNRGAATLARLTAGDAITGRAEGPLTASDLSGTALALDANGDVSLTGGRATAGGVAVNGANVSLADLVAAGAITTTSDQSLTILGASGQTITARATGPIDVRALSASAGAIIVTSIGGAAALSDLTASGDILAQSGGALTVSGAQSAAFAADGVGDVALTGVTTGSGDLRVQSSGGAARIADTSAANDLIIRGASGVAIDGQVRARGLADIGTPGAIAVNGQLTGGRVALTSVDLAIATGGGLLAAPDAPGSTGVLTLNATGAGTTFLGGPANAAGYSLSGTEMAALRGHSITINAGGAVEVGAFTMTNGANGNFASDGVLSILTPTSIRVNGAVRIDAMPRTAALVLGAGQRIVVDPATGMIDLRSGDAGGLGGFLRLRSNVVYVATDSAIAAIAGLTDPTLIDARLAQNDGILRPDNIVRAIDIMLEVSEGAYIQNLGAGTGHDQRRGFLATGSTLYIDTASADTRVVINGQLQNDAAPVGLLSGLDVTPIIMVNGVRGPVAGGRFDQRSTVNGCLMIDPGSCRTRGGTAPEQGPLSQSNQDAIDRVLDPNPLLSFTSFLNAAIELRDYVPQAYLPLIDEPVTGAGNDDLWQCDEDKPGCARPYP